MRKWHYKIRGLRQHLSEDVSPEALRKSATGVTGVLEAFVKRLKKKPEAQRMKWEVEDYGIERLEEIIEEMKDAGGIGDCGEQPDLKWFNGMLGAMWAWCDGYNVWVETDHPETGV